MSPYSSTIHRLSPGDLWLPDSRASAIMVNELAKEQSKLPSIVSFNTPSQCSTASSSSSVSSIPTNLNNNKSPSTDKQHPQPQPQQQTSLSRQSSTATQRRHRADTASLKEYGECYRRLGQGTTAVVMVLRKLKEDGRSEKLYAIKQFRKQKSKESKKEYMKKLTSEFCISSTLLHKNVVETIDLVLDDKKRYCTVMEYCPGGDLFTSIMSERMTEREKACSFKQMMEGLAFIHSMGVAHRDLKPENLLLTMDGKLKITDFGVSDVFRFPWESKGRQSRGLVGSEPYIAPEAFEQKEYWGAAADVWSAGIVFYCIWFGGLVWHKAKKSDGAYAGYVRCCEQNQPFDMFRALPAGGRQVITRMLNVQSDKRITSADVLKDPWVASIPVCENSIDSTNHVHEHTAGFQPVCPVSKK